MNSLSFKHSVIFFNLCILMSPIYQQLNYTLIVLCLFLILIVGISHGALDNIKGERLFKLFGLIQIFYFIFVIYLFLY